MVKAMLYSLIFIIYFMLIRSLGDDFLPINLVAQYFFQ